jgi:hypothetical protein
LFCLAFFGVIVLPICRFAGIPARLGASALALFCAGGRRSRLARCWRQQEPAHRLIIKNIPS